MRTNLARASLAALFVISICAAPPALGQAGTNTLTVGAEARLRMATATNESRMFLTLHLVNSAAPEVTVLTRGLNFQQTASRDGKRLIVLTGLGNSRVAYKGHPVVPSLHDLAPVTLRSNEAAIITKELAVPPGQVTADTELVVRYVITPEWAERFGVWSGAAETEPFRVQR